MSVAWKEIDHKRYQDMLYVLPPALHTSRGFLMGEPHDHRVCTVTRKVLPRYLAYAELNDHYFEATRPLSVPEFHKVIYEIGA